MANGSHPVQRYKFLVQMFSAALKLAVLGLLTANAALAQKVTVEFDKSADFTKFKTFSIRGGELNSRNPALNSNLVKKQIETDIEQRLTSKGLTQTTGDADLNVRYTFGQARKVEVETYPAGWYGMGTRAVRVPYAEGTPLDLRDPATRSLVWRGVASDEKTDPAKLEGKIDDMVKKSIDKYPPKK